MERGSISEGKPKNRHVCKKCNSRFDFPRFKARPVVRPPELSIPKMPETEEVDEDGQIIKVQDMTEEINSAKFHLYKYSAKLNLTQIMKY